jgi:hypothetical protein
MLMKVVILGTGSTSGTFAAVGGVDGFVRRLATVNPAWEQAYGDLRSAIVDCGGALDSVGLDAVWTRLDYSSKFRLILGSDYGPDAAIQLRQAIADAYSFSNELTTLCASTKDFSLKRVLAGVSAGDAIISFNWDTVAETVFTTMLGRELVQAPHPSGHSGVRLIKPHGSLSWIHRHDAPVVFREGSRPILQAMASRDIFQRSGGFAQPLILGAVPIKSELLAEIQKSQASLHETVADQWREAIDVISRADAIEVVGYRFPPEDGYGRFLLCEALRRRPHGALLPVLGYFSLERDRGKFEQAFRDIFGSGVNYTYEGPVTPPT